MECLSLFITLSILPYSYSYSEDIKTYTLNNGYATNNKLWDISPEIDCLHTNPSLLMTFPDQISFCYRSKPLLYVGRFSWSTVVSFGTIKANPSEREERFMFGVWKNDVWFGIKNETDATYRWLALGVNFLTDVQIWRHTCFAIDFINGRITLVENGIKRYTTNSELVKKKKVKMNHVSIGCVYVIVSQQRSQFIMIKKSLMILFTIFHPQR